MRWMGWTLLLILTGCVLPEQPEEVAAIPAGKGQLVLKWNVERSVLGSSWAASVADAYELLLLGPGGNRAVDLTAGASQAVAVDPGVWRLVVLVGVKRSSGSTTGYLVGSALAEGVVVTEGQRTGVDLTLRSIDLSLTAGSAYWKESVTIATAGKSRNPRLGMLLAGASTTSRPRFKSAELWNGYREVSSVTGTPSDWSAEAVGTVPNNAASVTVALVGAGLCVEGADGVWIPTSGWTKLSWYWPNRADLVETHPLVPFTELVVPAGPPATGMDVSMRWE